MADKAQQKKSFSALQYRDFRLFWAAQWVSFSGTWMQVTAQGWLVYELTRSPFYLGMVSAAASLPILLFSLPGGAIADRFPKRNLLIVTQALSVIPPLAIGLLTSFGHVNIWHVMGLGFALGVINAFDIPARQAFLIDMVERNNLLSAIALNSAAFNGARMLGPMVAGFVIAWAGTAACFYINALSFVAVVVALSLVKARGVGASSTKNMLHEIREGMGFIMSEPQVLLPMLLVAVFSLFGIPFVSQLPVFADKVLGAGARGLGMLMGASGVGALSAALYIAIRGDVHDKPRMVRIASMLFPAALIAFSISPYYYLSLGLMAVSGYAVVMLLANANSIIQLASPDHLRGRVISAYTLTFLGMTPFGHAIMGVMAEAITAVGAVLAAACICLAVSLIINARNRS